MSGTRRRDDSSADRSSSGLTEEEIEAARSLAKKYEGDPLGRICEILVQSSTEREEANS